MTHCNLIKGLLNQMSSKFNEQTNSELVKNLDYQEDKTLKWKTLINNTYAKKDREKRNKNRKDGEDLADDKSSVQHQLPPLSPSSSLTEIPSSTSAVFSADAIVDKREVMDSSESDLIIGEKFGNNVKEKKIVIDDDLHTREQKTAAATSTHTGSPKESDDEKNISTNLPQLNTNSQAIESTKVTTTTVTVTSSTVTDKRHADNTVGSSGGGVGVAVALSDDDKRAGSTKPKANSNSNASKTIDKTSTARNLRSNKNSSTNVAQVSTTPTLRQSSMSDDKNKSDEAAIKSDLDENEGNNEDSSATNDTAQSTTPKKGRGRPKLEAKATTSDVKMKSLGDVGEQTNESESEVSQKRSRSRLSRLRSIIDTTEEKKPDVATEDVEVKKETEMEETPKRRGRSRKLVEEKEEKESEMQIDEEGSKSQDQSDMPKRKRGRFNKKPNEADGADDKSESSKVAESSDDVKPRLLMTIRTDKSAVPKIITAQPSTSISTADDQEKIIKKRGRRPKSTSITKPIQVKKSLRLAKDGSDLNISEVVSTRKEKPEPAILAPPLGRIRSQRRIKPTAKILANEELRQGFEVTNCKRLSLSNENLMDSYDRSPTLSRSGNDTSSNKSPVASSPEKSPKVFIDQHQDVETNVTLHKIPTAKKPIRDPQDFLNEIKSFKLTTSRSPEENKKLTKSQQRRLIKAKEKHLGLLGLRPKVDHSDTSNESSTSEDFVPAKFNRAAGNRPALSLRLRNQRAAEIHKRNVSLRKRHNVAKAEKRLKLIASKPVQQNIDMSDDDDCIVVESSKISRSENVYGGNKENNNINFICSCHQSTKYFINTQNVSFTVNGKMFCCAIDEIETRKIGCTNELTEPLINLFRPSVKVSYMALCSSHKKRLVSHNCCSGCGIFCTQGTFVICNNKHFFHRNCATKYILNTPYEPNNPNFTGPTLLLKCPHCGIDAPDFDYRVTMRCENLPVFVQHRSSAIPKPAKMGNMIGNAQPNHQIQLNSLALNIDKLIPETVAHILKAASDRLKSQHASTSNISKMFQPKDIFYSISRKDGDDRIAEIVSSGFNLLTPLRDFHNGTCLHLVSNFGSLTMAYLILSRSNSHDFVNLMDKEMRTPIMYSVAGKKHDILKLLCQCGADVTLKGPDGMTVLHLAAKSGNITATQIILENYRQIATISKLQKFINTTDDGHWTALVWAAENGYGEIVNYLISLGADPNICDSENNTVLHWACLAGKLDSIYPLVSNTDLNIQNIHGDTALHISARQSKTKICMLLMAHGASLSVRNLANETPLDVTDEKGECGKLLKFNMDLRHLGIGGWKSHIGEKLVLCNDISNGREVYPIQIVKNLQSGQSEDVILPDFKYITKNILLQNSIQIDQRISQMRVCSCSDNCISENCQCAQISLQNWYNVDGRLIANFNYADPPMLFECNDVCQCNKLLCKNRVVQNGTKLPLVVFESDDKVKGFGVKCLMKIRKGSFVAQYTGEILTDQEADRRTDDSYFFDLGASDHCIDANFYGNVSRFFNHSCSANIVPVRVYFDHQDLRFPKIAFFASRDIEAGEEIAFDYGEKFWMIKYKYFKCSCKSDKCRYSAETIDKTVAEYNQRTVNN